MAVPLPLSNPVRVVVRVRVGVVPPLELPANPLAEATATEVKYDPAGCLLLNVDQTALDKYPSTLDVATGILRVGVNPPVVARGAVTPTELT